jgi:antitoxin component of MazEF toxin-antitoxin module
MKNSNIELTTTNEVYTANVISIEENGDAVIELPQNLLDKMGWAEGTKLNLDFDENHNIILKECL